MVFVKEIRSLATAVFAPKTKPHSSENAITLQILPHELLTHLSEFLDGPSLINSLLTCRRFYHIFRSPIHWSFAPRAPLDGVTVSAGFNITFAQDASNRDGWLFDAIVTTFEDGVAQEHREGMRRQGDRAVVSRMPIRLSPRPRGVKMGYYEVEIIKEPPSRMLPLRIGVGLESHSPIHPVGSKDHSVGYQNIDGFIAIAHRRGEQFQFAPKYTVGDVVGCGYTFEPGTKRAIIFFTLNGSIVGEAPYMVHNAPHNYHHDYHALISSGGPAVVKVNVGLKKFLFEPANDGSVPFSLHERNATLTPTEEEIEKIAQLGLKAFNMEPNVLENAVDPLEAPVSDGLIVWWPINDCPRNVQSHLPLHWATEGAGRFNRQFYYYECKILTEGLGLNSFMSIGLATKPYSCFHQIGWDAYSVAYHSDDGNVFHNSHQYGKPYGPSYQPGVIIGCGYYPSTGTVFFTRDGVRLGDAVTGVFHKFYASVGANRAWNAQLNFGQEPFAYEPANRDGNDDLDLELVEQMVALDSM